MIDRSKFYIDGAWVAPLQPQSGVVVNPSNEEPLYEIALGSAADIMRAAKAARDAFPAYSATSIQFRLALLDKIIERYRKRAPELAKSISLEMGAPVKMSESMQVAAGLMHLETTRDILTEYKFSSEIAAGVRLVKEPIGIIGMITPWNWPLNQIACKVAPALAAGCTLVLKPSEFTPTSALIFADILHEAGVPAGVFNLVNGLGPTVGTAISESPEIDMVSFTGSTRAGIDVATRASLTIKRVSQELGGKSPNVILDDAPIADAVFAGTQFAFLNSGQSCNAPTRIIVPEKFMDQAADAAKRAAESMIVGDPFDKATDLGPVVSRKQWEKIQHLIEAGVREGARLAAGGLGLPDGKNKGFYVKPTIFADVSNDMTIAREEIFGPVVAIIGARDEDHAVQIANDTPYGLAGYVQSASVERAREVAGKLRAGNININGAPNHLRAPFGGYKQSGNGREWGKYGIEDYLELKAIAEPATTPVRA